MSKRIKQNIQTNGDVSTFTTGRPRGKMSNFDVSVFTPNTSSKKATALTLNIDDNISLNLSGRQAKTLSEVLSRHFEAAGV